MNERRILRLVDRRPPEPRINVCISAIAGRGGPHGRSRAFRLSEEDIEQLLVLCERLERRAGR